MGYRVYVRNKKTKPNQPGWWPDSKKIEVVTTYLSTGSVGITESLTNVPRATINTWRRQPWWKEQVEEIQNQEYVELDKKLTKVMEKALDAVADRLENGEYIYDDKTGKIKRVPAKLRDTHRVLSDMIDKKKLIQKTNKPEKREEVTMDHLVKLAEAFASFTGKKIPEKDISVIEGEVINDELKELTKDGVQN